ncbi:hypothetical protein F7725_020651 [Dissostichus mawsoni]|uniref:RNA helicase n=2 Tax=Dissostichus TaxID=36199 RepID=A0A7J5YES0_DISMA|nr:hypothetical protein F7725_020651 [Dissostichus mawsoni]
MSHEYGGGGGRRGRRGGLGGGRGGGRGYRDGSRDGSRERWDRGGGRGSGGQSSDFDQDPGGGGQRDRPPPHLKGRDIGMWYARYGAVRRKQADRRSRPVVQMDAAREQHITKLLNSVQNDQPGPARDCRDAGASTSDSWRYFDGEASEEDKKKIEFKSEEEEEEVTHKSQRYFSPAVVKDEAPDAWDKDDQQEKEEKESLKRKTRNWSSCVKKYSLDERLQRDLQSKKSDPKYKEMLKFREKLPSYNKKEELVQLINSSRVLVVSGETGCGKTTQVTQFILDDYINRGVGSMCRVVCTQPRRISAISVAERVSAERAESVGNGNSCGYQIRLQSRLPRRQGSVLYCTTGIILQWLRSDPMLSSISHLVLDEIHERNLQSDVLLVIVKELLNLRDDLKVILMSATLNAEKFSKFFDNCPVIHIPGLTFPVEEFLLEDIVEMTRPPALMEERLYAGPQSRPEKEEKEAEYKESWPCYARTLQGRYSDHTIEALEMFDNDDKIDLELILALIRHIVLKEEEGAILVFLPGWSDISSLNDLLTAQQMFRSDRFVIIPLHSLMPTVNQTMVFKRPPPGVRKIVIATNIAETSITIDDVVYVIDGGKIKETHFDTNNNISTMTSEWVSLANAKQRKGRAGRVCPGKCYHLYNGLRASLLDAYQLPEIMRTPLEELCLQIKVVNVQRGRGRQTDRQRQICILKLGSIAQFLEKALDPPTEKAVNLAIKNLIDLNALDHSENLTALGFHWLVCLWSLTSANSSCSEPCWAAWTPNSKSDHLTIVNAFQGWEEAKQRGSRCEREYCWDNFLSANTLQMLHNMKGQFADHLMNTGFVSSRDPKDPKSNVNSDNEKLIKAVIVAGLYPKVAMIKPSHSKKRPGVKVYTQADGKVCIHPKSVNAEETEFNYKWLVYHLKMRTSSIFLYDCTEVSPFSLLFFGGDITIQKDEDQETIAVDQWIVFSSPARIAHLVKSLKKELDSLLEEKIRNPAPVDWQNRQSKDCAVITAIIDLITTQDKPTVSTKGRLWRSAPRGQHTHFKDDNDDDDDD